jgi:hypothetical protein
VRFPFADRSMGRLSVQGQRAEMATEPPSRYERLRVTAGYYALVVAVFTLVVMLPWSSSWVEAGILGAVGAVSAICYRLLAGKQEGTRWSGTAPRNTQLQQPPPAIVRKSDDGVA